MTGDWVVSQAGYLQVDIHGVEQGAIRGKVIENKIIPRTGEVSVRDRIIGQAALGSAEERADLIAGVEIGGRVHLVDAVVAAGIDLPKGPGKWIVGHVGAKDAHPRGCVNAVAGVGAIGQEAVIDVCAAAGCDVAHPHVIGVGVEANAPRISQAGRERIEQIAGSQGRGARVIRVDAECGRVHIVQVLGAEVAGVISERPGGSRNRRGAGDSVYLKSCPCAT